MAVLIHGMPCCECGSSTHPGLGWFLISEGSVRRMSPERTAYYEAGHAVMAWKLRKKFKSVTIIRAGDTLGHMTHPKSYFKNFNPELDSSPRALKRIEDEMIICFAGQIAEKMFSRRENWRCSKSDWKSATDSALLLGGDSEITWAYTHYIWLKAKALMRQPWIWYLVRSLAKELVNKRKISYREARQIIDHADKEFLRNPDRCDPATFNPSDPFGYWIDDATLVCTYCVKSEDASKIKKYKQVLKRSSIKEGKHYCSRYRKKFSRNEPIKGGPKM